MKRESLARIGREVLGWPGVSKVEAEGGTSGSDFRVPPATAYRPGRRRLGHVHHAEGGLADLSFSKERRDDPIRSGRAIPHPASPESKTGVGHELRSAKDVREVIELFCAGYERAVAREGRHADRNGKETG